jgi:hypothetical protein
MSVVLKVLGVALVIFGVAFPVWRLARKKGRSNQPHHGWTVLTGFLAVFAGLVLTMADRITELTVQGIGTIHAVTEQAISDAQTVSSIKIQVEEIKAQVEHGRATVDIVATEAVKAKEVSELVNAQSKDAAQKLEKLNLAITSANDALQRLQEEEQFQTLILAAQNDDRPSFDKLKKIAEDKDSKFNTLAGQAWVTISEAHSGPMFLSGFTVPWSPGVEASKLLLPELSAYYKATPSQLKPAVLEYIWKRDDIPKLARLDFMMEIMKTDTSLTAAEYAGRYFTQGTDQKIKAMALEYLSQWWNEHRQEFIGK